MAKEMPVDSILLLDYKDFLEKEGLAEFAKPSVTIESVSKSADAIEICLLLSSLFEPDELVHTLMVLMHKTRAEGFMDWVYLWTGYNNEDFVSLQLHNHINFGHMKRLVNQLDERDNLIAVTADQHICVSFNNFPDEYSK
jgi:hypothetical protein